MKLQKFGVKLFLNTNGSYSSKDFIPVFHSWIQVSFLDQFWIIFGGIWGSFWVPKVVRNRLQTVLFLYLGFGSNLGPIWEPFWVHLGFLGDPLALILVPGRPFWTILDRFWIDFGVISEIFWELLGHFK